MIDGINIVHSTVKDGNFSYVYGDAQQIQKDRQKFLATLNRSLDTCVALNLKHTSAVSIVSKKDLGKGMYSLESGDTADAMVTDDQEVTLFLLTADCLPVVIYDPIHKAVALVHVSKINTREKYLPKVMQEMQNVYKTNAKDVSVYIGPCVHRESYDFDLVGTNVKQLMDAGIDKEKIEVNPADTYTSREYFSHRRTKATGEPEGRFATVVVFNVTK